MHLDAADLGCSVLLCCTTAGAPGFHFRGEGGGSIEPPKMGGGFRKRAQLTGTINQLL